MTVFTIYYNPSDGIILAYQEGGLIPPDGEGPPGSKRICYDKVPLFLDEKSFQVNKKVDLATGHLVPLNGPNIIFENPPSADRPIISVPDPNNEIRHVE